MTCFKIDSAMHWTPCCNHYVIYVKCRNTMYTTITLGCVPWQTSVWKTFNLSSPSMEKLSYSCANIVHILSTNLGSWMISPFLDHWLESRSGIGLDHCLFLDSSLQALYLTMFTLQSPEHDQFHQWRWNYVWCVVRWILLAILQVFTHCPYFDGQCLVPGS